MKHRKNGLLLTIVIVFAFHQHSSYAQYFLGDDCYNTRKGAHGTCRKIEVCQSAIADLRKGIPPQRCGFEGNAAIICCAEGGGNPTTTTTTSTTTERVTTTTTKSPKTIQKVGDKAKQKCKDYEDLGWILERPPILIPGQGFTKRSICPWEPGVTPVIIDGEAAKQGEFPHMALVGFKTDNGISWDCGGSLISENFVVTAAHCLNSRAGDAPTTVRLGDLNYTDTSDDRYVQQIEIEALYEHPDYASPINYHDIALLKLARPAKLDVYVKPICLYSDSIIDFDKALVSGWGNTEYAGDKSDHLMKAALDIFSTQQCSKTYRNDKKTVPRGVDESLQLCAGSFTDRKDTCQGDSGGPIQIRATANHCSYYLLGVTSFGKLCGNQNIPAIYTKIFPHMEWIEKIVWP